MKNNYLPKITLSLSKGTLVRLVILFSITILLSCTRSQEIIKPQFEAITFLVKESRDTIIHWHRVGGADLERFRSYPRFSVIHPVCDLRIQEMIIGKDKCK